MLEAMKTYSLDSTPFKPVTHDPELKKRVLVPEGLSCIRHISHILLLPGSKASSHRHEDVSEVFYCIKGGLDFIVKGKKVSLKKGGCLIVEPGEEHSIESVNSETELLYLHASS